MSRSQQAQRCSGRRHYISRRHPRRANSYRNPPTTLSRGELYLLPMARYVLMEHSGIARARPCPSTIQASRGRHDPTVDLSVTFDPWPQHRGQLLPRPALSRDLSDAYADIWPCMRLFNFAKRGWRLNEWSVFNSSWPRFIVIYPHVRDLHYI